MSGGRQLLGRAVRATKTIKPTERVSSQGFQTSTMAKNNAKPLYADQDSLPQLPVPPLEQTLKVYERTTLPLQASKETLARTQEAVQSALSGQDSALMKALQERLLHRANAEGRESWLYEWWKTGAYMGYRDPLVPFVSYFYLHKPVESQAGPQRAAELLKSMMVFREMVVNETLTPEKTRSGSMCMEGYKWMFNVARVPVENEDQAITFDPRKNNHVIVLRNGHFYEVPLVHPETGKELSAGEIQSQLEQIVADPASQRFATSPVGALTSDNRDNWTEARAALERVAGDGGAKNRKILERIDSSILVLALDDESPVSLVERSWSTWSGAYGNRFYDKQQITVANNGTSGYVGEHSMMDGTHTMRLNNFMLTSLEQGKIDLASGSGASAPPAPVRHEFVLDADLEGRVRDSYRRFEELLGQHALAVLDFQGYGKGLIKQFKNSPDAWAQMAIQLAFYKLHGHACATYEAAQTRAFKLGRTETIRSASPESLAFVQAMQDPSASDEDRISKFQAAAQQHLNYARSAANGQGVDRHFFGLKRLLRSNEEPPALFRDPMFGESGTWILSTSQISSEMFDGWGFGEVTPDGYGVAYAIKENSLTFTIVSRKDKHVPDRLTHYLNRAALEMRDLHQRVAGKSQPKM